MLLFPSRSLPDYKTSLWRMPRFCLVDELRAPENMSTICIGRKGAGKTHLLSCLRDPDSINFTSHSVPSVGTNIFRIKNPKLTDGKTAKGRRPWMDIREIGGAMSPLWNRYYENVNRIIFVIDTSNLCEISGAGEGFLCMEMFFYSSIRMSPGVLFYSALVDTRLYKADVLLVLTKMDLAYRQMRNEALLILNLKKVMEKTKQKITIVETSAVANTGVDKVLDWLFK